MAGLYCQRHPERTVLYRVLFHYFEWFLEEYEQRFEKEYGYLRPIIQDVVNKYLDCGNPKNGFEEALLKYFKVVAGRELTPGIIAVIQSFGSRINLHPHLHFLVSEGGSDREGPTGTLDGSRGERGLFLRDSMAVFYKLLSGNEWVQIIDYGQEFVATTKRKFLYMKKVCAS